jgi:PhoH-like ATPase
MKKNYVLDTNVLLHDPHSITSFQDNNVLIPIQVLEEIDIFKKELTELGQNARAVSRALDQLRELGKLCDGVLLDGGGTLRVVVAEGALPVGVGVALDTVDDRILGVALHIREAEPSLPAILVTKDTSLRVKADALGLRAEDYETDRVRLADLYRGAVELQVSKADIEAFGKDGCLSTDGRGLLSPNEYVCMVVEDNRALSVLGRVDATCTWIKPLLDGSRGVRGVRPRNREQYYALDALLEDEIPLVTLMGKAGTGKTLLALAAGLQKTLTEGHYQRFLVARPTMPLGKGLGHLPGSMERKLAPWMQPIYDNLELLQSYQKTKGGSWGRLVKDGVLAVEPLSYIRGRNLPNQYILVDEAQNLTPLEVKTIITRVGDRSKIVLTGDPYQIDNPYVDGSSNGFNSTVNRFRDHPIAAHVELVKGERSHLAELASDIL